MRPTKAERVCMDSLLEGTGFEPSVPLLRKGHRAKLAGESPAAVVQEADFYAADSAYP
jgi:hypothetical protein